MTLRTASPPFIQTTNRVCLAEEYPLAPSQGIALGALLGLLLWVGIIALVQALI